LRFTWQWAQKCDVVLFIFSKDSLDEDSRFVAYVAARQKTMPKPRLGPCSVCELVNVR